MDPFHPFVLERMMSKFEQEVEFNLSESGVLPVRLRDLLEISALDIDQLLDTRLDYPQVNGYEELRRNIARTYLGAGPENVLVTVGAIEANYLATRTLLAPGDEIVIMQPNYMQIWGIAKNHDLKVKTFPLVEKNGWAPDLNRLEEQTRPNTRMIAICNPNNPTGRVLTRNEMEEIVYIASRYDCWLLADEVYRGAEREKAEATPSFFGMYDKVLAVGSMSKAYGLPGLRIGWVVGDKKTLDRLWARHEYITITASVVANRLAATALEPSTREALLARTRGYIQRGYPVLQDWMAGHPNLFSGHPPDASAVACVRYRLETPSIELVESLVEHGSTLVVPGAHFGLEHHLRISFGLPEGYLRGGLARLSETLERAQGGLGRNGQASAS